MEHDRRPIPAVTDAAIATMFERRARRAEGSDLRGQILTATLSLEQRSTWRARLITAARPGRARALVLVMIALILAALAVAAVGALRTDRPLKSTATGFARPFEYVLAADSGLRPAEGTASREIIGWVDGPELHPPGVGDPLYGGQLPETGTHRGIMVAAAESAWSHSSTGRFVVRTEPAQFLADLQTTGNVPMSTVAQTTLDGRPALTAIVLPTAYNDIHVSGPVAGLSGRLGFVALDSPARLTVADIDGITVFVLVWARTADDLDAWMPVADRFLASMHFLPEGERP